MTNEITRLQQLVKMGEAVVQDFMPNIGRCALQDYGRLNQFLLEAAKIPEARPASDVECHGLDTPERVFFYEQDYYVLSNFSAFQVQMGGVVYSTAEHAYQTHKFLSLTADSPAMAIVADEVRCAPSAHMAYKLAESYSALVRTDWPEVRVGIMRSILKAKCAQHPYVSRKLLQTGTRELVENSWRDDFWGWGPNRDGQNMLGRLWMGIRSELSRLGTRSLD